MKEYKTKKIRLYKTDLENYQPWGEYGITPVISEITGHITFDNLADAEKAFSNVKSIDFTWADSDLALSESWKDEWTDTVYEEHVDFFLCEEIYVNNNSVPARIRKLASSADNGAADKEIATLGWISAVTAFPRALMV